MCRRFKLPLAVMTVSLIGLLTFKLTLGYFFTGTDTFTLIESAKITSVSDLSRIFLQPLMWGSDFLSHGKFYRPISTFSYSLDYSLWGLDPFGYHLTDLILHVIVIVLVFFLIVSLTGGDIASAWLGAVVFAIHPILVESVPAPALRHDVLASLFLVLAFLLFLKGRAKASGGAVLRGLSLACYVLALCSKEIALFFPALILTYVSVFSEKDTVWSRVAHAGKASLPYLLATLVYVVWRIAILGGLGGYADGPLTVTDFLGRAVDIAMLYFHDLLYPHDLFNVYDVLSQEKFVLLLVVTGLICLFASFWGKDRENIQRAKPAIVLVIWLFLPLAVLIAASTFSHRNMYIAIIPVAALVGYSLVNSFRKVRDARAKIAMSGETANRSLVLSRKLNVAVLVLATILVLSLFANSPLVRSYGEVRDAARMAAVFFDKLSTMVPSLPVNGTLHIYNLPSSIRQYENEMPRAREVGYLNDYSIKSWLNLHYPGNRLKVVVKSRFRPERLPEDLRLIAETNGSRDVRLFVMHLTPAGTQIVRKKRSYPGVPF